jgi:hypothetical protein
MATRAEKAFCMLENAQTQFIMKVQRRFRPKFGKDPPVKNSIKQWYEKFHLDGCLCIAKRTGRPDPSEEREERVREAFQRSTRKSTNRASLGLDIPQPTVWRILRKRLQVKPYRLQLLQALTDEDKTRRLQFCTGMLQHLEEYGFAANLIFSHEATFHLYGKVNRHNVRIRGTENPKATIEHIRKN